MKIVITGATRGCGRALVHAFAEGGHTVFGCGRSAEGIRALEADHADPHAFARVDVARDDEVAAWAAAIVADHGAPELVLANAGLINKSAPLWEVPQEEFDAVLRVNLGGVAALVRHFVPAMIDAGRGVIVNFSSGWGRSTAAEVAPYCATKWGVEGLTSALAQELPPGLAAVALNPGIIHTEMLESCFGGAAASYDDPGQWAKRAAPFLLGLGAKNNGESLTVP